MTEPGMIEFKGIPIPEVKEGQVLEIIMRKGVCEFSIHVYHGKHPILLIQLFKDMKRQAEIVRG